MSDTEGKKTLIIAEKPSVAGDIARALGVKREKEYFENEKYVVSSAVGHLLEIVAPEGAEVKRGKWSLVNLPVLPDYFDLVPIKASQERLRVLTRLYKRKDIGAVINACDAGREGELIFYNLMQFLKGNKDNKARNDTPETNANTKKTDKPVQRLWLSSMTPAAIRGGFENLRENSEIENLRRAAVCRAEADWLIGINSTRAMTALHSIGGGFFLTTVGRVQTPTLAIIVERERQIKAFVSQKYWEIHADFAVAAGTYSGVWVHDKKTIIAEKENKAFKPERIFSQQTATEILEACRGEVGFVTETVKPTSEISPGLFDLTSLQREANARFSMSARGVLATAQSLYERHKLITYPRTDSRCLPEDYPAVVKKTLEALSSNEQVGSFAQQILNNNWVVGTNKRIFNNSKVSDHFAIIPTGDYQNKIATLQDNERKIYDFICRRFLAVFFPAAKFLVTERRTKIKEHEFLTKGRVLKEAGWRAVAAQMSKDSEIVAIAPESEDAKTESIVAEAKNTQPPARYSEATLLSAMEGAGKWVEDEELRDAMRERGLGTPATRAAVIEGLVRERYIVRDFRELIPTPKARSLMRLLQALKAETLTQPSMTGDWEYQLRRIEKAEGDDREFMKGIRTLTSSIVTAAQNCGDVENITSDEFKNLEAPCPQCGGQMSERHRRFSCNNTACNFFIWKAMGAREFSSEEVELLLATGSSGELEGFRSRLGREFSAEVKLSKTEEGDIRAAFDFNNEEEITQISAEELAEKEKIATCPKCSGKVFEHDKKYICQHSVGEKPACDFSFARRILQREISPEQLQLLLTKGKTALLDNFISRKTRRPFKAYLTMALDDKNAKLAFEFEPRAAKTAAKSTAKKPAAKKPAAKKTAAKKSAKKPAKKK